MSVQPDAVVEPVAVRATDESGRAVTRPRRPARTVGAVACGFLAIVALSVATVAVWGQTTAFDSSAVAGIVGDALAERDVEVALTDYLTDQALAAVDVEAAIEAVAPAQLQRFAPMLAAGARTAVHQSVSLLVAAPETQQAMTNLVERSHRRIMRLLQGDGALEGVSVIDGEVTVNLLPLIGRGAARLQELGLVDALDVPDLAAEGDPAEQIAGLEAAIGRDLPDDFGQLVVYRTDHVGGRRESLERAQQIVTLAKRATWALVGVSVLATVASVLLARDRWRAVLLLALAGVAAMVVIRSAVQLVISDAPDLAVTPGGRAAIDAIVGGAAASLLRLSSVVTVVSVAVAVLTLIVRGWPRGDLVAAGAVLAFVASIAVLGLGIVGVMVGLIALVSIPVVAGRIA